MYCSKQNNVSINSWKKDMAAVLCLLLFLRQEAPQLHKSNTSGILEQPGNQYRKTERSFLQHCTAFFLSEPIMEKKKR